MKRIATLPCMLLVVACQVQSPERFTASLPDRAVASIALPDDRPVWEIFPRLECRGSTYMQCSHPRGSCVTDRSLAHLDVDFRSGTVTWIGRDNREAVLGRTFRRGFLGRGVHVQPRSAIYLTDPSKAIDFGGRIIEEEERRNPGTLPASMTHTSGYETFVHRLRCAPIAGL